MQPPSSPGGQWTLLDIHDFLLTIPDGLAPNGVLLGPGGVLYGTTCCSVGEGSGIVFKLTPSASGGSWNEEILYAFTGNVGNGDGYQPNTVTPDGNGGFFGTTIDGGVSSLGFGTVFHLTHAGSAWTESVIYTFTDGNDGAAPQGGVLVDSSGNLYGTTERGGAAPCTANGGVGCGTVFELSPPTGTASSWSLTTVHDFVGGIDGVGPRGNMLFEDGILYGVTAFGGSAANAGTVFRLTP